MKLNVEKQYAKNGKSYNLVVATNKEEFQAGLSIINNNGGFLLIQINNNSWQMDTGLTMIGKQSFGNTTLALFRKVINTIWQIHSHITHKNCICSVGNESYSISKGKKYFFCFLLECMCALGPILWHQLVLYLGTKVELNQSHKF